VGKIFKLPQSMANVREFVGILDQLLADDQPKVNLVVGPSYEELKLTNKI